MSDNEVQPATADLLHLGQDNLKSMMGSFTVEGDGASHPVPTHHGGKKGRSKKQRASLKRHTRKVRQQYKKLMRMMRKRV